MATRRPRDRFVRQAELVPGELVSRERVSIIGTGAVGKPLAEELVAIGVKELMIIDPDKVEAHNITTQGWLAEDVGKYKVEALHDHLKKIDSETKVTVHKGKWVPKLGFGASIFTCVDSIDTRAYLWKKAQDGHRFFGDARMLGLMIRVLSAWDQKSREHYATTLFTGSEAQQGRCTSRSAIWPARLAACLLVNQFVHYLNGDPVLEPDIMLNLNTNELMVINIKPQKANQS